MYFDFKKVCPSGWRCQRVFLHHCEPGQSCVLLPSPYIIWGAIRPVAKKLESSSTEIRKTRESRKLDSMSLKVFNRVHVQNFGNIATFNINIFFVVFWISLIRMDSLLLDFVTLHQSIEEWGHPRGWGAKQLSLTVSTSNTESTVLTVPCYQNSAWWIPQT